MVSEIIIPVMGVTGAGKSSFIKLVTGSSDILVGHGLVAGTSTINQHRFSHAGRSFVLVDTPGFNDTNRPDTEILRSLLEWLEQSYRNGGRVTGILYLHPITSVRMTGTDLLSISMLQRLCGSQCFGNIYLGTSKWGLVDAETGNRRERMLTTGDAFWMSMIQLGSRVLRVPDDQSSARKLITDMIGLGQVTLRGQEEMVKKGVRFDDVGAVQVLTADLIKERAKLEAERRREEGDLKANAERERHVRAKIDEEERKQAEALLQKQKDTEQQAREEAERGRLLAELRARKDIEEERKRVEEEEAQTRGKIAAELAAEERKIKETAEREKNNVKRRLAFDSVEERASNEADRFLAGNEAGKVIARFAELKLVYIRICCNCLNVIGSGDFFSEQTPFPNAFPMNID